MRLYSAKVRLGGNRDHEVIKHNLTPAEIHVIQHIHVSPQGHPSVVDIVYTGDVNRTDAKERARLAQEYTKGELVEDRGTRVITGLFGVAGVPLPQEYVAPEPIMLEVYDDEAEDEHEVITPVAPVARAPKPKKPDAVASLTG